MLYVNEAEILGGVNSGVEMALFDLSVVRANLQRILTLRDSVSLGSAFASASAAQAEVNRIKQFLKDYLDGADAPFGSAPSGSEVQP